MSAKGNEPTSDVGKSARPLESQQRAGIARSPNGRKRPHPGARAGGKFHYLLQIGSGRRGGSG
jgi:hypothetical protein